MKVACLLLCLTLTNLSNGQSELALPTLLPPPAAAISAHTLDDLSRSYAVLTTSLQTKATEILRELQLNEAKLESRLQQKDPTLARQVFAGSAAIYQRMMTRLQTSILSPVASLKSYIPGIDSINTAIRFLSATGTPEGTASRLQAISRQLEQLQGSFQGAAEIRDFVTQRETELQNRLGQLGFSSQLLSMNKSIFYYQQQLAQYKNIVDDQQQQQRLLSTIRNLPAFQNFWQKNSMLASLIPSPANSGTLLAGTGLQTRAQVGNLIQQRLGTAIDDDGAHASDVLRQKTGEAQGQMDALKQRLDNLRMGSFGGNTDMALPDFDPNSQKQKTFLHRLEYGFNIQGTGATPYLPGITTIGLSLGYKLSDKATAGTGVCYLLGVGYALNNTALTNQGAGLRTFLDIKAKGSLWITGGYEWNYMQQFTKLRDIGNLDIWQQSALIGLTKKCSFGKKTGNVQLLYNILADRETPRGQPLLVRFGYSL